MYNDDEVTRLNPQETIDECGTNGYIHIYISTSMGPSMASQSLSVNQAQLKSADSEGHLVSEPSCKKRDVWKNGQTKTPSTTQSDINAAADSVKGMVKAALKRVTLTKNRIVPGVVHSSQENPIFETLQQNETALIFITTNSKCPLCNTLVI